LGIALHLTKPIKQSDLLNGILKVLGKSSQMEEQTTAIHPAKKDLPSLRILLAEDNPVNQQLVVRILEKHGHRVVVTGDGQKALAALAQEAFDLVLMDVQMPEMDGFDATAAIREKEKSNGVHIPIIAMTAHAMKGDKERCLAAGMDSYVAKPIHANELFDAMENLITNNGETEMKTDMPENKTFNLDQALARLEGDKEIFEEMAKIFLADCPRLMSDVREAIARVDGVALQRAAHAIKGAIGNFAAEAAFEAALKLEMIGRNGGLDQAEEAYKSLEEEIEHLAEALTSFGIKETVA
jgi:CheY-like chemotaxis protein